MCFSIHVTNDQKLLLNTLQVVFNMVLRDDPSTYHIEEILKQPLQVICTTKNFCPSQPDSLLLDLLSGFVHFTYKYFRGQALVANIKVKDGFLTGMCMVDLSHCCGTTCFALDLKPKSFKYENVGTQDNETPKLEEDESEERGHEDNAQNEILDCLN
ncbi:uncharacterized protein MELLADRAFT_68947 [Melampsora larici-populina 98AG31]|uniref:Alpha-type protein kinase domain-containing protein n=1 Tax=Melampsora larici-populina (strain 98AG31 / pathotype 3-4-7) TaxID=747676 RepID=F4S8T8_MELLP|nr:uncharacterized protein MELLADRAFT_68947 [Melampsora larici-populina 98AG31]EGF98966.1 hypothetical protein MELLADRAFT_68947 [Melampsora larici-populina 98AG31]